MPDNREDVDKRIRVMHLIWSMGDGGAQQVVINYLRDFNDDPDINFRLYVYNASTASKYDQEIKSEHYPVVYLDNPRSKVKIPIVRYPFNKRVARKTWYKVIKDFNPDIVHVHISELLDVTLKPIIKAGVPIRFDTLHSNPLRYKGHKLRIVRSAFNKYGFIPICVTNEQAEIAKKHYGFSCYELIRNGVDINGIRSKKVNKALARECLKIEEDAFVILGIGRLDAIKNFELLVRAFAIVSENNPKAILLLAGKGPEKDNLVALAKELDIVDVVKFLGYVNEPEIIYSAADVLGVPSISESSSLVLIEAQIMGLRAVISGGVPDESIISDRVCKIKAGGTTQQWAEALLNEKYESNVVIDINEYDVHLVSARVKKMYNRYCGKK